MSIYFESNVKGAKTLSDPKKERYVKKIEDMYRGINAILIFLALMFGFLLTVLIEILLSGVRISLVIILLIFAVGGFNFVGLIFGILLISTPSEVDEGKNTQKEHYEAIRTQFRYEIVIFVGAIFSTEILFIILFLSIFCTSAGIPFIPLIY